MKSEFREKMDEEVSQRIEEAKQFERRKFAEESVQMLENVEDLKGLTKSVEEVSSSHLLAQR